MSKSFLNIIFIISLLISCNDVLSQVFTPGDFNDGIYVKENSQNKKPIPYTSLRESDVQWSKRVWRKIDLREKINQPLYYPIDVVSGKTSFLQLVINALLSNNPEEKIWAFKDDEFKEIKDTAAIRKFAMCQPTDSTDSEVVDPVTGNTTIVKVLGAARPTWLYEELKGVYIKEDWFFDKQKSVMESRIIGIGFELPVNCEKLDFVDVQFWIYFPQLRPHLAKTEVYNTKNDAERRTFDDIFWKRQFNSTIIRESNVYDRGIETYAKGIDALLENERIKYDLFKYEHDFWQF
jgi:gliding motility associated protien GldN